MKKKVTVQVGNKEDDIKKVFVKMLPPDVTETELQQLSPDIRGVQLKSKILKYKKGKQLIKKVLPFAILEFDNEKMAEKNHAKLKGKEIRTYKIEVDFVGEKSSQEKKQDQPIDKKQLYISSIKESVSVSEMKKLYPKAKFVKLQKRKVGPNRMIQFAFVVFENEDDCEEALKAHTEIAGEKVHVSFARAQKPQSPKTIENNKQQQLLQQQQKQLQPKQKDLELMTNSIYVGQIPENVVDSDIKKLFPKSTNIELIPAQPKKRRCSNWTCLCNICR